MFRPDGGTPRRRRDGQSAGAARRHYVKRRVRVHDHADGTLSVFRGARGLARYDAVLLPTDDGAVVAMRMGTWDDNERLDSGAAPVVTIGEGELLNTYTLLIPRDKRACIPVDVNGWKFELGVKFDNGAAEQGVDVVPDNHGATLVFRKWDNSLGTALLKPVRLATLDDGHELAFMASNYAIGETNRLDLQLLLQ